MALRKIKIVNNSPTGVVHKTEVFDAETNEPLHHVKSVEIKANADDMLMEVTVTQVIGFSYEGPAEVKRVFLDEHGGEADFHNMVPDGLLLQGFGGFIHWRWEVERVWHAADSIQAAISEALENPLSHY